MPDELSSLLAALSLPHPSELPNALGPLQHEQLLLSIAASLEASLASSTAITPGARPSEGTMELTRALKIRQVALSASDCSSPFVRLPTQYSELYNHSVRQTCEVCGEMPLQPAVCLLCGQLVCAASDCCRSGGDEECCRHARSAHQGAAAFLIVRRTEVLLVLGRRHCWWGSLYLDQHGEEDRGLRRGRPLLLAPNRLRELTALWQANGLREFVLSNPPQFPHLLLLRQRQHPPYT